MRRKTSLAALLGAVVIATAATAAPNPDASPAPAGAISVPPPAPLVAPQAPGNEAVETRVNNASWDSGGAKDGVDPAVLKAEVLLDRVHRSPGVIDGRDGTNFQHALQAFETGNGLAPATTLDAKSFDLLLKQGGSRPVLVDHLLTEDDVAGPFFPDLPKDYAKLATLPTIGYRSVAQKLGARFHMGEALLAALNPGVDLGTAGGHILVADPTAAPIRGKLARILVDKSKREVIGYDEHGVAMIVVPATIGSRDLPSPSGTYKVKGVAWNPVYYYDPKNFVQGDNTSKLRLPPGPNNPVGSVFVALTKPTYGLHGTPDPSAIDKTASHGCVRMTNWDATELAHLVRPGLRVSFVRSVAPKRRLRRR